MKSSTLNTLEKINGAYACPASGSAPGPAKRKKNENLTKISSHAMRHGASLSFTYCDIHDKDDGNCDSYHSVSEYDNYNNDNNNDTNNNYNRYDHDNDTDVNVSDDVANNNSNYNDNNSNNSSCCSNAFFSNIHSAIASSSINNNSPNAFASSRFSESASSQLIHHNLI